MTLRAGGPLLPRWLPSFELTHRIDWDERFAFLGYQVAPGPAA
ncbi:MAG TPA: hypothetical protein VIF35_11895 [Streptosporangiaceae bacterium]